jgi:hypothetical protein
MRPAITFVPRAGDDQHKPSSPHLPDTRHDAASRARPASLRHTGRALIVVVAVGWWSKPSCAMPEPKPLIAD